MGIEKGVLLRIVAMLGVSAVAAMIVAAVYWYGRSPDDDTNASPEIKPSPRRTIMLYRDTIAVSGRDLIRGSICGGKYDYTNDCVKLFVFRDTMPVSDTVSHNITARKNKRFSHVEYHEIGHAVRSNILPRVQHRDVMLYVNDEIYARMDEKLAQMLNMPSLQAGMVDLDINYRMHPTTLPRFYFPYTGAIEETRPNMPDVRTLADSALIWAIGTMNYGRTLDMYLDKWPQLFRVRTAAKCPDISYDAALDSMRTVKLDGMRVNMYSAASPSVRDSLARWLDMVRGRLDEQH